MVTFSSLSEAIRQGYHVYERTSFGYVVRIRTSAGYALAHVVLSQGI